MLRICGVTHPECKFIDEISIALVGFANEESREMHLLAWEVHSQAKIYQIGKLPKVRFSFSPEPPREMHLNARAAHSQTKIYRIGNLPEVRFSFSTGTTQRDALTVPCSSFPGKNLLLR